ncbi:MAG: FtsX-like permease family protein [bacterium]
MFTQWLIGLRNLRRRPGRTLLTIGMIATSTLLMVFVVGVREGTYTDMIELATGTWSGQFQVAADGYRETPSLFETIDDPDPLITRLEADPRVAGVTPRVSNAGLLSAGGDDDSRTVGALLTAVVPEREQRLFTVPNAIKEGTWLTPPADPEHKPIVLGRGVAKRLRVALGDEITYLGQAADGSIAADIFILGGIIESGAPELDANVAFIRLADAQELFALGRRVHTLHGKVHDLGRVQRFTDDFAIGAGLELAPWMQVMPGLEQSIEADRVGGDIFLVIILFVVVLGIVNSMLMAVFERTRELGIMMALGTTPRAVVGTIVAESTGMAAVGVILGALGGVALNAWLAGVGIPMGTEPVEFGGVLIERAYPHNTLAGSLTYPAIVLVAGALAGLWPARRAARLDPVHAIREG